MKQIGLLEEARKGLAPEAERLLAKFEVVAEAPGGVKRLRELILELAVRGRLVQQESGDERAIDLLARIAVEQQEAVLSGHTSKLVIPQPVAAGDLAFDIPHGWCWTRWGALTLFTNSGWSPQCENRPRNQAEWGVLKVSAVSWSLFDPEENKALPPGVEPRAEHSIRVGDFLMSRANTTELVGRSVIVEGNPTNLMLSDKIVRCAFSSHVERRFINYFNRTSVARDHYRKNASGTSDSMKNISREVILGVPIPLPPLAEQKRIVAKVDEIMKLCDDLEARQTKQRETAGRLTKAALHALTSAEGLEELAASWRRVAGSFDALLNRPGSVAELRASVLELAVRGRLSSQEGRPGKSLQQTDEELFPVPFSWAWARTGNEFDVAGGIQKTPLRAPRSHHFPYLRVENVQRGRLDLERIERFELEENELERRRLMPGDILVVEGNGSATEIGRCALWSGEIENCVHQNHIIRCRPVGGVSSPFALLFLNSPTGMAEMRQLAITTSGLHSLSVGKIRGIILPVPPLAEQARIVAKVDELMKLCDALEDALRRAEDTAKNLADALVAELLA